MVLVFNSRTAQGKTTIINKFLDKDPSSTTIRPTLALEYSFVRRTASVATTSGTVGHQHRNSPPICHVWELGGGGGDTAITTGTSIHENVAKQSHNLCDIPLRSAVHGLGQMRIVLILDLSKPEEIWTDLMQALQRLETSMRKCDNGVGNANESLYMAAQVRRWQQMVAVRYNDDIDAGGADKDGIESVSTTNMPQQYFPVPLVLIGGKYDVFQNFGRFSVTSI